MKNFSSSNRSNFFQDKSEKTLNMRGRRKNLSFSLIDFDRTFPPLEDKYFSFVRYRAGEDGERQRERDRVLRCSPQTPLCRNVPLFSYSYDATKFKRGILAIRRAIHCAWNNPVAKTLRFTRHHSSWLPVDTEFIFHAPLSAVSMFHRHPLILEFSWPRLF